METSGYNSEIPNSHLLSAANSKHKFSQNQRKLTDLQEKPSALSNDETSKEVDSSKIKCKFPFTEMNNEAARLSSNFLTYSILF